MKKEVMCGRGRRLQIGKERRRRGGYWLLLAFLVMSLAGCRRTWPEGEAGSGTQRESGLEETAGEESGAETSSQEDEALFADAGFGQVVCSYLSIPEDATDEEKKEIMAGVTFLRLSGKVDQPVRSLEDLHYFTSLETLEISYYDWEEEAGIADLSGIGLAKKLKTIYMENQSLEEMSFLEHLTELKELYLPNCGIRDISQLEALPGLERLSLYGNEVADISALGKLTNLVELTLNENKARLEDYSVLAKLTRLEDVGLSQCGIRDIEFVRMMPELKGVNFNYNEIEDLSPLEGNKKLERIGAVYNNISDISVLSGLTRLYDVALDGNHITDLSPLKNLQALNSLGISGNPAVDVSFLEDKEELFWLNISDMPLEDVKPVFHVPLLCFNGRDGLEGDEAHAELTETAEKWLGKHLQEIAYYYLEDVVTGDMDRDGGSDLGIVVSELIPSEENSADNGKDMDRLEPSRIESEELGERDYLYGERRLFLLLSGKDGSFRPLEHQLEIGSYHSGGMRGDPYRGILIQDGYLLVQEAGGSRSGWTNTRYYRYRDNGLELIQEINVGDDNFAYGYDVSITKYPEKTTSRVVYALSDYYHFRKVSMDGWEKLRGEPQIDLYEGSYNYFEEKRTSVITSQEALSLAEKEFGRFREELSIPVEEGEVLRKMDIGYTQELKNSYELLKGVELPDYFYGIGDGEEPRVQLYYDYYGMTGEKASHVIRLKYYGDGEDYGSSAVLLVYDEDGTVELQ